MGIILFEEDGKEEVFNYNGFKVRIKLLLRRDDVSKALSEYKRYWFDNIFYFKKSNRCLF